MVMAESRLQDVELKSRSVGVSAPSDAPATRTDIITIGGDAGEGGEGREDGMISASQPLKVDEQILEDGSARSDTDTSRAGSVTGDHKNTESKPTKKFAVSKPVSFAKYSVPKAVAASSPIRTNVERAPSTILTPTSATSLGRARLVAKTTSALQPKTASYKLATPDPMQVWNKNRVTPQPSTKHLTDEELKQQYGIHLTSRLQTDGDGKEAKWADIDDDEDDWAPETIEWNDGTKTTVNPADAVAAKDAVATKPAPAGPSKSGLSAPKILPSNYSSSVGPNATVLKVGANAERQQLQRATSQQSKGAAEKPTLSSTKAVPAPTPAKSPWAQLPAIDKVSPIAIHPQAVAGQPTPYSLANSGVSTSTPPLQAPSPAKEMSADDFSRSWRDSSANPNRELFMPNSGRYEAVPESRRRLSRNEQNFRAPAVLQRPGQGDARSPAEPSAAFQTHRTSIDQGRRRASSSISGGSGQIARRLSLKSSELPSLGDVRHELQTDPVTVPGPQATQDRPPAALPTPTYQARGEHVVHDAQVVLETDIEAQRAVQKAAMKENIERARRRKIEEEQREEAEKQQRIKARLAALGPPPPTSAKPNETLAEPNAQSKARPAASSASTTQSPPKPPQPLATGEPQQYGMMKVHPLDSVKKITPPSAPQVETPAADASSQQPAAEKPSPAVNGVPPVQETPVVFDEEDANPEPSPKFSKVSVPSSIPDSRAGWSSVRGDHRQQQTNNLWGLPSNKALGNGVFDQSLAGYSPQDLSRTSSTGQPWMNGRTPTVGQSPQLHHATNNVPETRSQLLQSMTSPSQQPLNMDSEADSIPPASRPAPIGPPPQIHVQQHMAQPVNHHQSNGLTGWNNFHNVARVQEKAEAERFQRESDARREEEKRTGIKQQAPYSFNETFKQVQLGDQAGQRHVSHVAQSSHVPNGIFGAVGSLAPSEPARMGNGQPGRGSRFFPATSNGPSVQERRAVTYSHPGTPRTPSPPPAEEYSSLHPAFDGSFYRPVVHFPREKAVVRLPPSMPPVAVVLPVANVVQEITPAPSKTPMTWADRVSMPAPTPIAPTRAVSTSSVPTTSWQERFNGLLGRKEPTPQHHGKAVQPTPALAVTREPLDVVAAPVASVSLPLVSPILAHSGRASSRDVEEEEDLFEDREAGSLPIIRLVRESFAVLLPRVGIPRSTHQAIDPISVHMFMVHNWNDRHAQQKPQYAIVRLPGAAGKGVKKDLSSPAGTDNVPPKPRNVSGQLGHKFPRAKSGYKSRGTAKAH